MNALGPVALKLCRGYRQGWLLREGSIRVPVRLWSSGPSVSLCGIPRPSRGSPDRRRCCLRRRTLDSPPSVSANGNCPLPAAQARHLCVPLTLLCVSHSNCCGSTIEIYTDLIPSHTCTTAIPVRSPGQDTWTTQWLLRGFSAFILASSPPPVPHDLFSK